MMTMKMGERKGTTTTAGRTERGTRRHSKGAGRKVPKRQGKGRRGNTGIIIINTGDDITIDTDTEVINPSQSPSRGRRSSPRGQTRWKRRSKGIGPTRRTLLRLEPLLRRDEAGDWLRMSCPGALRYLDKRTICLRERDWACPGSLRGLEVFHKNKVKINQKLVEVNRGSGSLRPRLDNRVHSTKVLRQERDSA
jgi:hypothetical protein